MTQPPKVSLYDRLPEIYRIKDGEQQPPGQLRSYLAQVEAVYGAIQANIEALYDDLFIETSASWVIPYIGDLLGSSPLSGIPREIGATGADRLALSEGDAWTLRADVADTIALRRRKGTLASIERLTYDLTQWGVACLELRESLAWNQHLNHQRPDAGGLPPLVRPGVTRFTPVRGGMATVRDPAMLSLLGTPFDPFARVVDVKPPVFPGLRYNLPDLAIFLWRLEAYRVPVSKPVSRGITPTGSVVPGAATHLVRFDIHPLGEPLRLFNRSGFDPDREPPVVTEADETPGPILPARLMEGAASGRPEKYLSVESYNPANLSLAPLDIGPAALQLHVPEPAFAGQFWPGHSPEIWRVRAANLCAWEAGVRPNLFNREIVIDPLIGRLLIGVGSQAEANAVVANLLVTYTYGSPGPVGAHPAARSPLPVEINDEVTKIVKVDFHTDPNGLRKALDNLPLPGNPPLVIEIQDSLTYDLNLSLVAGILNEDGGPNLLLSKPLVLRAAPNQRPVIRLRQPLRFRPADPAKAANLFVRLEGLYLTRGTGFPPAGPLVARAALNRLEVSGCTLDPGGHHQLDGTRAPIFTAMALRGRPYGFAKPAEAKAFDQIPEISLDRCITGPLLLDGGYTLSLARSILDAGKGVGEDSTDSFALSSAPPTDPKKGWGPHTQVNGVTFFGRVRVESIDGRGGIWVHTLEVLDNQKGCLRYSYFSAEGDRLPQNLGCMDGTQARLAFTDEAFGEPAYGQLAHEADFRIKERGPGDDAMGAYGFLLEAHKWRNIQIRYREFMPVGIRPLLVPVT